ncbi:MAG: glutamate-5-semialdehyde dehydrogenase [Parvularculaceae bacterium]
MTPPETPQSGAAREVIACGKRAQSAASALAESTGASRAAALRAAAAEIRKRAQIILAANAEDLRAAEKKALAPALIDRLLLSLERLESIAAALEAIADRPDPVGAVVDSWTRPNRLQISRVRTPIGVLAVIYESRPNVTADAAALCLKAGNAVILRGGSESLRSNKALHSCIQAGLSAAGLPEDAAQLISTADRAAVGEILRGAGGAIDLIVPRGGKSLVARVQEEARAPVLGHLEGVCHVYIHQNADVAMAASIAVNAKMRRPGICGAAETLLMDAGALDTHLAPVADALIGAGCALRGDAEIRKRDARITEATHDDWSTEYLAPILSIRSVSGLDDAVAHIRRYGSGHTESIITANDKAAEEFLRRVDSAIVLHNASTQFADGGEFGMGAEIGIATGKLHARGPVGVEQLTAVKYVVRGAGQTRP